MSALITLLFTSLYLFIIYEQRQAVVNEGMSRLQTRMMDIFNDNELIADATGVRYHLALHARYRCFKRQPAAKQIVVRPDFPHPTLGKER